MENAQKFLLRIEGQGEYLQNAQWAWIHSVRGFNCPNEMQKCKHQKYLKGQREFGEFHKKVKIGIDYPFEKFDNAKIPINPKISGHNGEVLHYLCIDSTNGKDYLHIGFIYEKDSEVRGDFMGQTIIIKNAKNLDFDFSENSAIGNKVREKYTHLDKPDTAKNYRVTECRNFWFGAYFYGDKI